ncbi:FMN-dependent NADH-azoreductase [Vagococcus carniphilus]|uniref:FMN-dependent NADH-azoreductase n=1 Tax=Vagococcus carniphilus TaxID=218144 RepID=UPI003B5AFD12
MKTLIINAHPDYTNKKHYSVLFQEKFLFNFKKRFPEELPTIINLYEDDIPRIEHGQLLSIWDKEEKNEELNSEEKRLKEISLNLLNQFKNHHRIVLTTPLHNFNVTSKTKDYIDNLLIARETFKYTEDGSVGLMTDDYKLLTIQASGSIYTKEDRYKSLDISSLYIKGIFEEIMGFSAVEFLRLEGTAFLPEDLIISNGEKELSRLMDSFY